MSNTGRKIDLWLERFSDGAVVKGVLDHETDKAWHFDARDGVKGAGPRVVLPKRTWKRITAVKAKRKVKAVSDAVFEKDEAM